MIELKSHTIWNVEITPAIRTSRYRSSGYRSPSTTSGARVTAIRYTTTVGFNRANRFIYDPRTRIYRYGTFTGRRFGVDIKSKSILCQFTANCTQNSSKCLGLKKYFIAFKYQIFFGTIVCEFRRTTSQTMSVCLTTNIGSVYWPVYGLYFNPIYKQGDRYNPPIENADNLLNSSIAISNTLQKQSNLFVLTTVIFA